MYCRPIQASRCRQHSHSVEVVANVWTLNEVRTVIAWAFLFPMVTPHERAMCMIAYGISTDTQP